jgi:hypothetical protein
MSARARRLCSAAAIALAAATTGCGGGSSAEETRAEMRRWAAAVDDVCRATRAGIAERGQAQDLLDLRRVAERASADVRGAVERIRRVPRPDPAHPQVGLFLAELRRIEPPLSRLTATTADGSLKQIGKLGLRLADGTRLVHDRARAAGLRECARAAHFDSVHDALTAPVFATQLARFEIWLARALRPFEGYYPPRSPGFAFYLRGVGNVLERAEERMDDMYEFRPSRVESDRDLAFALDAFENVLNAVADELRGGRRVLTRLGVRQFNREVRKRRREVDRAITALRREIGAEPLVAPRAPPRRAPEQTTA